MSADFKIKLGNFLFKNVYFVYKPMYSMFKKKQDAYEIDLLKKNLKPGEVIIDIGSNIGFYAKLIAEMVGEKGQVHCFEPDLTNFDHLKKEVTGLKNVKINNKAVGPKTEKIKIYTSKELNVDHRTYEPEEYDQVNEIESVSIDDYVADTKNGISTVVDFIKIDIQGFEMQAIKGMSKTLAQNPNIKLISEFWPYGLDKAGSSASEYFNYLSGLNFNCYLLEGNSLSKMDIEKVRSLEKLSNDKTHYFNILATRDHV